MLKSTFEPCIPTPGTKVPESKNWIHEIKHDGYRLIVQTANASGCSPATDTIGAVGIR
jgi:ATP-dependent DNA ligase